MLDLYLTDPITETLEGLRRRGYARLLINGQAVNLDEVDRAVLKSRTTLEVVVDRLKIRTDAKQRLAESFETALRHADGRALAVEMDTGREHLFSAKFACPVCSYSLPELEPRLFSFNNPMGACPRCDGLGQVSFFDPRRVVAFPELSLASGAIKGWDRRNQFYFQMLQCLATHYAFDLDQPFAALTEPVQQAILHGSGRNEPAALTAVHRWGPRAARRAAVVVLAAVPGFFGQPGLLGYWHAADVPTPPFWEIRAITFIIHTFILIIHELDMFKQCFAQGTMRLKRIFFKCDSIARSHCGGGVFSACNRNCSSA